MPPRPRSTSGSGDSSTGTGISTGSSVAAGIGGIVGALLTGLLATAAINPVAASANLLNQTIGLVAVMAWSAVGTFAILMICKFTTGRRVAKEEEIEGLDYTQHGETVHP
jgi:Amt family ammonium transporter